MSREKRTELLINASKSNNSEVISNKQIEEMAFNLIMATSPLGVKDLTKQFDYNAVAKDLYELYGWRKQIEGEWIAKNPMIRSPLARNYYCSVCKYEPIETKSYCPECGAKMKGDSHTEQWTFTILGDNGLPESFTKTVKKGGAG